MKAVIEMAKAHLQNVENKIRELETQKNVIDEQINSLKQYLVEGNNAIVSISNDSVSKQG